MNTKNISIVIKLLCIFFLLFLNVSCTNTRLALEGTKRILNKNKDTKENIKKSDKVETTSGHYKIGNPYIIDGVKYIPKLVSEYDQTGIASWYGPKFHLNLTANGEVFDQNIASAAHKTLPLPSIVKVTDLNSSKVIYLRVNDRGPFVNDRIIDFSKKAAIQFNFFKKGTTEVRVELIDSGPHLLNKKYLDHNLLTSFAKKVENNKNSKIKKSKKFILQIGAFKEKKNAQNLLNYLKTKINDNLYLENFNEVNNDFIYKVFVGPYYNEENAKEMADKLFNLGFTSIFKKI